MRLRMNLKGSLADMSNVRKGKVSNELRLGGNV